MSGLATVAAEYLALVLPGSPEQAARMVGLPVAEVERLRALPNVPDELAVRRARLNMHTIGSIEPPQPVKRVRPAKRQPVTHHVPAGAERTICCWRRVTTLPEADHIAADRAHSTCRGATP